MDELENNPKTDNLQGGQGAETPLHPRSVNVLVGRMLNHHKRHKRTVTWIMTDEVASDVVEKMRKNLNDDDGRVSNGAARNLIAMNGQNIVIDKEEWEAEHAGEDGNKSGTINIFNGPVINANLADMTYEQLVEYRKRIAEGMESDQSGNREAGPGERI